MAPEVANKPPLSSKSMASDGIGPRVIRSLWDRLTTWIRPDPADVAPVASFDRSAGSLEVRLNLAVRGSAVPLDRVVLARGRGRAADRTFKLSGRDAELVAPLGRVAHEVTFTTLRITTDSVPSALSLLRVHLATREAASAQAVTIRRAPLESRTYVELTDPDTLVVRDDLATLEGRRPSDLATGPTAAWLRASGDSFPVPARRKHPVQRRAGFSRIGKQRFSIS